MSVRKCGIIVVMFSFFSVFGADYWTPELTGKKFLEPGGDSGVVSGITAVKQLEDGTFAMSFLGGKQAASFSSEGILENKSGCIEFDFCPAAPNRFTNSIMFASGKYSIGYNMNPGKSSAVYFLTKGKGNKTIGLYYRHPLENGKWHHVKAYWDERSMFLSVDGKYLGTSGRSDSTFDKTFRIGDGTGGYCHGLIRNFKIFKNSKGSPKSSVSAVSKVNN